MPAGIVEVIHENGQWRIRLDRTYVLGRTYDRKSDAIEDGRDLAKERSVELIVRNLDGTIGERDSEGNDPRHVPG